MGLTFMELLVVLFLISILVSMSIHHINADDYRLRQEARNLRSTLSDARMEAIRTNETASVRLWTDRYENRHGSVVLISERGFQLTFSGGGALPHGGYTVSFSPLGTAPNSHYHLRDPSGNRISIRINPAGSIWLE